MNNLSRIHLAQIPYDIEVGAEAKLKAYLDSLRASLEADTAKETMADIEARITELLSNQHVEKNDVITADHIKEIIKQLGSPDAFRETTKAANASARRLPRFGVLLGCLVAAALATGMLWYLQSPTTVNETQTHTYQQKIARLELKADSGNVSLAPSENGAVTIERRLTWNRAKPVFTEEWSGETLRIATDCPQNTGAGLLGAGTICELDYTIRVPQNIALELHTESGNVTVTEGSGKLVVSIQAGDFKGTDLLSDDVDAKVDSGNIDVQFRTAPTNVKATAVSGNVDVIVPKDNSYRVQTETISGTRNISVQQDANAQKIITAKTTSGNVTIAHPGN